MATAGATLSSDTLGRDWVNTIVRQGVSSMAGGVVQQLVMNGKVDWSSLAISSVGSALGQGLAGYAQASAAPAKASVTDSGQREEAGNTGMKPSEVALAKDAAANVPGQPGGYSDQEAAQIMLCEMGRSGWSTTSSEGPFAK